MLQTSQSESSTACITLLGRLTNAKKDVFKLALFTYWSNDKQALSKLNKSESSSISVFLYIVDFRITLSSRSAQKFKQLKNAFKLYLFQVPISKELLASETQVELKITCFVSLP